MEFEGIDITEGAAAVGGFTGDRFDPTCGAGTNATIDVFLNSTEYTAAGPGVYTDTLTVTVTPL